MQAAVGEEGAGRTLIVVGTGSLGCARRTKSRSSTGDRLSSEVTAVNY